MANIKVLLVDDEQEFTSALSERLELRGYSVHVADNGEEALEVVESDTPDVVVLDLKMPGLDGIEVLKRIKINYPQIAILLLTGYGSMEEGRKGMRYGAYDYLMKPIDINELINKMQKAFEQNKI